MTIRTLLLLSALVMATNAHAAEVIGCHGYREAIELKRGNTRVVLCPEIGGRVLEFSIDGKNALYLDENDTGSQSTKKPVTSAGRFDYGPELTVRPHPTIWSGSWSAAITGPASVRLTSADDKSAGVRLVRELMLGDGPMAHLSCTQTIENISDAPLEVCHWGRSFSPGGGVCLVPLGDRPSRFPSKYAMYEESAVINVRASDPNIVERDGMLVIAAPPRKPKLGFDSYAGWLAYSMPGDLLFVKRFETYPDRVYNEAAGLTLSVWYPEGPRIELEPIGPRERLAPGERASFIEDWYLTTFPFEKSADAIDLQKLREIVGQFD
jgi:hypothetical protein